GRYFVCFKELLFPLKPGQQHFFLQSVIRFYDHVIHQEAYDGKLSFEEFNAYFADGILTTEELQELFFSIDGRQNNNLDTDKLSDYFSQHLGEYINVLSALESLNIAILKAMDKTKEEYQGSSVLGQFVTRFMLRETSSQLLSLQRSLQCAMEAVEEQSSPAPREVKAPELTAVQRNGRRCGRRVHNNLCMSPSDPCSGILTTGNRNIDLSIYCIINKSTNKTSSYSSALYNSIILYVKSEGLEGTPNILLVQRQMTVTDEDLDNFRKVLKSYIDSTSLVYSNLFFICFLLFAAFFFPFCFFVVRLCSYLQSNSSKDFQRCIIDMLEDAEVVSTMLLPASWWIMTNN
uniref:N-terminal EF-hand calcium binding protein 3 n=1 Tax=Seriola lalandi dorsalis TaxID=1841481 RepID=A0A3B4X2K2_SERLL